MTQSYRGLYLKDKASQLPSKSKGEYLMSNHTWVTPEEMARKKELKRKLLYISLPILVCLISAFVTVLANQI
jgi:hypothetical protein